MKDQALNNYKRSCELLTSLISSGVEDFVISPGMRCSPLIYALEKIKLVSKIRLHSVIDERTAGFIALGMAKAGRIPALICTSGTAGGHYYPALMEAFHSNTFFFAITADRPERLRGTDSNQTINQINLYNDFTQFLNIKADDQVGDSAIEFNTKIPVHINIEFEEPLIMDTLPDDVFDSSVITLIPESLQNLVSGLENILKSYKRPLLVISSEISLSKDLLGKIVEQPHYIDITSGYYKLRNQDTHYDLEVKENLTNLDLNFDVIIHIGGKLVSNNYYRHLENSKVKEVWLHTNFPKKVLSSRVNVSEIANENTLNLISGFLDNIEPNPIVYNNNYDTKFDELINSINKTNYNIFIGNSSIIRSFNNSKFSIKNKIITNRGVSGIDGNIATLIGMSKAIGSTLAIIGDIAAFHDFSTIINHIEDLQKTKSKIIVVNNFKGEIFDGLPIAKTKIGISDYISTPHTKLISNFLNEQYIETVNEKNIKPTELSEFLKGDKIFLEWICESK